MDRWYLALMALALLGMLGTLIPMWRLVPGVRSRGMGRIVYFSLVSLKTWVALVLVYFSVVIVAPALLPRERRIRCALALAGYLVVQSATVNVAYWRWWRKGERRARRGAIPGGAGEGER
jgi:hypothetical protein